jgi:hypothetical protein
MSTKTLRRSLRPSTSGELNLNLPKQWVAFESEATEILYGLTVGLVHYRVITHDRDSFDFPLDGPARARRGR